MNLEYLLLLLQAPMNLTWRMVVMILIAGVLLYLAIAKDYEPLLLLPIAFGCILTNLPLTGIFDKEHGLLGILYRVGIETEIFPLLIFVGLGAMTDFGPLLENPKMAFLGAAGHIGIFITLMVGLLVGLNMELAAAIAAIGTMDGPTAIYVATKLGQDVGPIAVAAYSYMSLVPIIQPPVMRLLTTDEERRVRMPYAQREVSKLTKILFPIVVTIIVSLIAPVASPLIATIMFGNLMRESGVVDRLAKAAEGEIANVATIFLGLTVGASMTGESFLRPQTLAILVLGLLAFVFDMAGGLLFAKILYYASGKKFNPLLGAAGISAYPMSARVVQRFAQEYDFDNFVLMHAIGANTAGQLGSVMAGGVLLALVAGSL